MIHITPPSLPKAPRFLPVVPQGFVIGNHEPLSVGLRRLTVDQIDEAIEALSLRDDLDRSLHEVRKATKRLRSVLRLIRDELGEGPYRAENDLLRDASRVIGPVRDAAVMVETVVSIRERFDAHLRPTAFAGLEQRLVELHERARSDLIASDSLDRVRYALRSAKARYRAWPVEGDEFALAYGRIPVEHSFETIRGGLARTYGRGRREMRVAAQTPSGHNFHQWRKRVKYLRHQMELLQPLWPEMMSGYVGSLVQLGDLLGEEHDLAALLRFVVSNPMVCPDPAERTLIGALAQHRRSELQTGSLALGRRVYAESPSQFTSRMRSYWAAWDEGWWVSLPAEEYTAK